MRARVRPAAHASEARSTGLLAFTLVIAPRHTGRLQRVTIAIIALAMFGIITLAWPLPNAPDLPTDMATAERYARALEGSTLAAAFDPDGHDTLIAEHRDAAARPASPTTAFLLVDAAQRHADATVFPRWTAVFALLLCWVAGIMGLWRAQRTRAVAVDPGPEVCREGVGLTLVAMLVSALLVGWTAKLTSTLVTAFAATSCGALMIAGRVMPHLFARPTTTAHHAARMAVAVAVGTAGVLGRRALAPPPGASAGTIVSHALPMLACTGVLIVGVVVFCANLGALLWRRRG